MSKITLSPEQECVLTDVGSGRNVLVTGSAGTGKSTILREAAVRFGKDLPICASTGIAAVNVGGMTIHSWAGLGLAKDSAETIAKNLEECRRPAYKRIKKAKLIAIDEVSMIHGDLFELIDEVFRRIRGNEQPFGGVQLVLFGDFLQLPPVSKDQEMRFAFQSEVWNRANIKVHVLKKVFRQADQVFSDALNQIRIGNLTPEIRQLLKSRYQVADNMPGIEPVTVYTHNADVDVLNARKLAEIKDKPHSFQATEWGDRYALEMLQKHCLAPQELRLKVGAQVMLLWNLEPANGLANGSTGIVKGFHSLTKQPIVRFACGHTRELSEQRWQIKSGSDVLAERSQIPLRLAWAITSHKSQGITLDKIRVHLDKAFEYGQSYVALSRVRTLEGLFIESTSQGCIKAHPAAVKFYESAL